MKRFVSLFTLLLALALIVAAAPAALAGDPYEGNWSGTWTCGESSCEKTGGTMHGNITKKGDEYVGQFTIENTLKGTLNGPMTAWLRAAGLNGKIDTSEGGIGFLGTVNGNTFEGTFESQPMGRGSFRLNRQ